MIQVIKRDGRKVEFDKEKIVNAILKAMNDVNRVNNDLAYRIANDISKIDKGELDVEEIQDLVEEKLMASKSKDVARSYVRYRYKRELSRAINKQDDIILDLIDGKNDEINTENSNKNPTIASTQRDYMAGEVSKDISKRILLPKELVDAHEQGIIHIHDLDYFAQHIHNCDLINLEDMLQNGTIINGTQIDKPKSFRTACTIATQIVAQVASVQHGGQTFTLSHLAPFVDISRQKIRKQVEKEFDLFCDDCVDADAYISYVDETIKEVVEQRLKEEIKDGIQTIQYQINTIMSTNGQSPFVTVFMYLNEVPDGQIKDDLALIIEEMLNQRILGTKNEVGVYVTPAFPKLIYVLQEDNIKEDCKYRYLTDIAIKCTSKRLVPDYISEKKMMEVKEGTCFPAMGCRSFLSPWKDENGNYKYYGRFNLGVCTINLVDVALSSGGDFDKFWKIFDERLELCKKMGICRYERLKGTPSDTAPILWQAGALARLKKGEVIDKLLTGGYSTVSLGYGGLFECVKYMTGVSHTDEKGQPFALKVMQHMKDKCQEWKAETGLGFGLYGTPMESTTYKFAKCLKNRFGIIEGVTDKDYITNSYHVHVSEHIDPFTKLSFESKFQEISDTGCISYIETSDLQNNLEAINEVVKFIYNNIMYAELNTKSDYCQVCGYDGEILIDENMEWYCPNCGNRDQNKMNVARRTCGYIGSHFWNYGRTEEIKERYVHLGGDD